MSRLLIILLSAIAAFGARATDYYMATAGGGGSDSNPGTIGSPFATIGKLWTSMSHGDRGYIRAGTYDQSLENPSGKNGSTWSTPLLIGAYNGESVKFLPTTANWVIEFANNVSSYIIISNVFLDGANVNNDVVKVTSGSHHIRLVGCHICNSFDGMGVQWSSGDVLYEQHNELISCVITNNGVVGWMPGETANHGVYDQTQSNLVERCFIAFNQDHGIHRFGGGDNGIYRYNTLVGNPVGVGIQSSFNDLIYGNVGYSNGIAFRAGYQSSNTYFLNNTAYKNLVNYQSQENTAGRSIWENNIAAEGLSSPGQEPGGFDIAASPSGETNELRNNLSYSNATANASIGSPSIQSDNLFGNQYNAQFVDPNATNFALSAGPPSSSARNTGRTQTLFTTDSLGNAFGQEGTWDIGYLEYTSGGQLPLITVNATDDLATEGPLTTGTFTFTRTGSTSGALTVHFTVGGTATSGTDYTALGTTIAIADMQSTVTTNVVVIQDPDIEADETVIVTVDADAAYTVGSPSSATVTIVSDDILFTPRSVPAPGNSFPIGEYVTNQFKIVEQQLARLSVNAINAQRSLDDTRRELTNTNAQLAWISNRLANIR